MLVCKLKKESGMRKIVMAVVGLVFAVSLVMFAAGCGKKKETGTLEGLGKAADSAVSSASDTAKSAGDDAAKTADDAKKKADEAAK